MLAALIGVLIIALLGLIAYHLHAPHAYVDAIMGAPVKPGPTSDLHIPETPPAAPEAQP